MSLLFLSLFLLVEGSMQGIITWLFREYVPISRQDWIDAALHWGGVFIYAILVLTIWYFQSSPAPWYGQLAYLITLALLARMVLFDVALNVGRAWFDHREKRPKSSLWAVGTSARSDRAVVALATWLRPRWPYERVPSAEGVRVACWVLSLVALLLFSHFCSPTFFLHG